MVLLFGETESHKSGRPPRLSRGSRWNAAVRRGARAARCNRIEREKMAQTFTGRKRVRKFFGTINEVAEMPNLIEVQKASYDQFFLVKEPGGGRPGGGLRVFLSWFSPFSLFPNSPQLNFVKYNFGPPKYDVDECR